MGPLSQLLGVGGFVVGMSVLKPWSGHVGREWPPGLNLGPCGVMTSAFCGPVPLSHWASWFALSPSQSQV